MSGLSYGVVRVDQENSLTSLTLQDCGQVMPNCEYPDLLITLSLHWARLIFLLYTLNEFHLD